MRLDGISHFLVSSVLGHEFAIGVRSGCFCAHPYLMKLLGYPEDEAARVRENILSGDRREMPGLIRVSFGLYNSCADVDHFVDALTQISRGAYRGVYHQQKASGEYLPEGWDVRFEDYFQV
jgi:selenocysteine lyase/cysteine desulfurase